MGGSSKLVLGLILGGMMAIDMGGPFNKAAYVFGTAAIAAGNYDIMAAVMIGGMTLHVQLHLQHYYLKTNLQNQKEKQDRQTSLWDSHLLPKERFHAAADPLHVPPACIVGPAAAGALSMAFGCTLMAPHGGIFVFL